MQLAREGQTVSSSSEPTRRWVLVETAPGWFRRVWTERSREVPKPEEKVSNPLRRIVYL